MRFRTLTALIPPRLKRALNDRRYKAFREIAVRCEWETLAQRGLALLDGRPKGYRQGCLEYIVYTLQQAGELKLAVSVGEKAALAYPDNRGFQYLTGVALKGMGRREDAIRYLRRSLDASPNDEHILREFIELFISLNGVERGAKEYADHLAKIGKENAVHFSSVESIYDWACRRGMPVMDLGDVEEIPFVPPVAYGSPQDAPVSHALSNKPYVADLSDVQIFYNSNLILASDGAVLCDSKGHPRFGPYVNLCYDKVIRGEKGRDVLLDVSSFQTREVDAGIFLSGMGASAFGHWLPDFLPRLEFYRQHPAFRDMPIIVSEGMPASHYQFLKRLAGNDLILLRPQESLRCRRLLYASAPTFIPIEMHPHDIPVEEFPGLSMRAMRFLQKSLSPSEVQVGTRRIFLARKNMSWRRLRNEAEIIDGLKKYGFETVFLEEMSIDEQIETFRSAHVIVAPNGSALLNVIFSHPSTKLLILSQPNFFNWGTFQGPMEALGYRPLWVTGEFQNRKDYKHSDYAVSWESMKKALDFIGVV